MFFRLSNPLTIGDETPGFWLIPKLFYDWNGLPLLVANRYSEIVRRLTNHFEIEHADNWRGHFMAGAFIALFEREGSPPPRL
jgi:hypothetical protein